MDSDSLQHQFLISLPSLTEDYFHDTISLIISHDAEGAFGLVINQPLETDIQDLFPQVPAHIQLPILEGGPVDQNRVFFLHPSGPQFQATLDLGANISLTTSTDFVEAIIEGQAPAKTIVILGYAGWGDGQLEQELANNIWLLAPPSAEIVFDLSYTARPEAAARGLGVDLNLISPNLGHD